MVNYESKMDELINEYNRLSACNAIQNFKISDLKLYDTNVVRTKGLSEPTIVKNCVAKFNIPMLKVKVNDRYKKGGHVLFNFTKTKEEIQELINNQNPELIEKITNKLKEHGEMYFNCSGDSQ